MNTNGHRRGASAGFTLIELLVVMGLIILLIGGFSVVLRQGSENALRSAGYQVASLLERARLVATSQQAAARLVIDASDSDHFMRILQVFYQKPAGNWVAASPPVRLPRGISVVPPTGLSGGPNPWVDYSGLRSTLAVDDAPNLLAEEFEGVSRAAYAEYAPNGTLRGSDVSGIVIAFAAVGGTSDRPVMPSLDTVRAITIPQSGPVMFEAVQIHP